MSAPDATATDGQKKEHLGIPKATFVEDVAGYIKEETVNKQRSAEQLTRSLDEQHSRYKMMEANLMNRRIRLKQQIPELRANLDAIRTLREKQAASAAQPTMKCTYLLADGVYARANVSTAPNSRVYLWLGAHTMLEYTMDEADDFLRRQLDAAESQLTQLDEDLAFLKDQITISEVNSSRIQIAISKHRAAQQTSVSRTLQSVKEDQDSTTKKADDD